VSTVKSLNELAVLFERMAGKDDQQRAKFMAGARAAYLECARVVRSTVVEDRSLEEEYRHEYLKGQVNAAWDIWMSMRSRGGDPRWQQIRRPLPEGHDCMVLP
jgi:hypothetical protein